MVSNFNMDVQHIIKVYVYNKFTEEIHYQGMNCVFMTKERYIKLLNKVGNNKQPDRKLRETIKRST